MRRVPLSRILAIALIFVLGPLSLAAGAQDQSEPETDPAFAAAGSVEIIEVSGLLDDVLTDAIEDAIVGANLDGARAVVLQVNSRQAVISDERLNELAALITESPIPVSAWVGPSGSRASGKVAQLVGVTDSIGVAIGAKLGSTGTQNLDLARFGEVWGVNQQLLQSTDLTWEQAIDVGIVACEITDVDELGNALTPDQALARCANATLGDFLVSLDTFDSQVIETEAGPRLQPLTAVRFRSLSLLDQLMHTVASPPVAYLMLVIGLALLVFEFYSIGIGIAGVIGAVFLALGGYGIAVLPVRDWALMMLLASILAFCIDVQAAVPRLWTHIGMVLFVLGTVSLYPESDVSMSWIPMLVAVLGMGVVMYRGMQLMVRGRFSTTAVPRDFLLDEPAVVAEVRPGGRGTLVVREASWPAQGLSGLEVGDTVVVSGVDGLLLEASVS